MRRRNPHAGLVVFWVKLRLRGYKRSITRLYRMLRKLRETRQTPPNPKYIPKPYEKMLYPGQRVQIDVKVVPTACIVGDAKGEKFYQYKYFYATHSFYSFEDFEKQLAVHSRKYNNLPMHPLNWKSPFQIIRHFLQTDEIDAI